MAHFKSLLLSMVLSSGSAASLASQVALPLNLATLPAENDPRPLPVGRTFVVQLRNAVPRFDYVVTPVLRRRAISPLTFAEQTGQLPVDRQTAFLPGPLSKCAAINQLGAAAEAFETLTAESSVPQAVRAAEGSLAIGTARTECDAEVAAVRALIDATTRISAESVEVPLGFDLTVVVTRTSPDPDIESKTWTVLYTGRDAGEWVTTYGFSFLTAWPWGEANESFVAEETNTQGEFVITRDATRERLRFVPTIFYTWHSEDRVPVAGAVLGDDFSYGLSGGLGFDLSNPVIAATFAVIYRRNLTLHLGVAAAQVDQLRGRYDVGDIVGNLTPEQLIESNYRINPLISLSFNFATSPFGGRDNEDEEEETGGAETPTDGEGQVEGEN